jgi:hypothetical protein
LASAAAMFTVMRAGCLWCANKIIVENLALAVREFHTAKEQ